MTDSVAVIGYGVTGQGAVRFLRTRKIPTVVVDTRPQPADFNALPGVEYHFDCHQWPQISAKRAVLSPGLSLDACIVTSARTASVEIVSDIDMFFEAVDKPVIGITGTNGKSTVTSLVGHLLSQAGMQVAIGGNLGQAALDLPDSLVEIYVLELSSFQLERSAEHYYSSATVLNVSEDHLDQHDSMETYVAAKHRVYTHAKRIIINREDDQSVGSAGVSESFGLDVPEDAMQWGIAEHQGERWLAYGSESFLAATELTLPGRHNELNALAASALVGHLLTLEQIAAGLRTFVGLPHRFELVAECGGVKFINDSKATNVGATMAALNGLHDERVVLIAGGDAKGVDMAPLSEALAAGVKFLVTLGVDGPLLSELADSIGLQTCHVDTMALAVERAAEASTSGDIVLLSPACSSLDMFPNYMARGDEFAASVREVVARGGE